MKEARKIVAAEVMREHINYLLQVAKALTENLRVPTLNDIPFNADQFLDELWKINIIYRNISPDSVYNNLKIYSKEDNPRQNRMLFKSLVTHTQDKVQWGDLDKWKNSWNNNINIISFLKLETLKMIDVFLNREESKTPNITANIKKDTQHKNPYEQMAEVIINELLRRLDNGESDLAKKVTRTHQNADVTQLIYSNSYTIILKFSNAKSAEAASHTCDSVAGELVKKYQTNYIEPLKNSIRLMQKIRMKFEEDLDPLLLQPIILRTNCELCPA